MFGHYLHAITAHLLELACLRSLNTENRERLFGLRSAIAEACTNHYPDNVIPQIMMHLQVKKEQHEVLASVRKETRMCPDLPELRKGRPAR